MGHCDNPDCKAGRPLWRWEVNELHLVVNGVTTQVRMYCNDCLGAVMIASEAALPRPSPVTEVTGRGETVVISPEEVKRRRQLL